MKSPKSILLLERVVAGDWKWSQLTTEERSPKGPTFYGEPKENRKLKIAG